MTEDEIANIYGNMVIYNIWIELNLRKYLQIAMGRNLSRLPFQHTCKAH